MPAPQNLKNHARFHPPFHFFLLPVLLLNFIFMIYITVHDWPRYAHTHLWWIVMAIVFFVMAGLARGYALKVQDRVIRLEERLRYAALLSPAALAASSALTLPQIIALRFASDAELPALITRTLAENLTGKQIKQSIITWRPDTQRV